MDFLRQLEIDWRTGDLLLNMDGQFVWLEDANCFNQAIHIIAFTQRGEDMLAQNMGLDRMGIFHNEFTEDPVLLTELKIKEAFGSTVDDRIAGIESLIVWKEGRDLFADLTLRDANSILTMLHLGVWSSQ